MANQKLTNLDAETSLDDADLTYVVTDVSTTAASKKTTWAIIKSFLKTYFDTVYQAFLSVNTQADSYTLVLGDAGKVVRISHADAKTLTIPKNSVVTFPVGTKIAVVQGGAGQITIAPVDGDVTLESYDSALKLVGQYAGAVLIKRDTDVWVCEGHLES